MDVKKKLQEIELFGNLTADQMTALSGIAQVIEKSKDAHLFKAGEEAHNIFIMLEGKVSIQVKLSSRPEMVSIVILGKLGQLIGWSGLMGPSHYTADAICLEDSQLLMVNGEEFSKILQQDCAAGYQVLEGIISVISERLRNLQRVVLKTM